uniref:Protein kinase domain-containing protein n=1 Tax=Steinernema glaseri TaxID=37863 RepID=A0A1I8A2E4_9BILA
MCLSQQNLASQKECIAFPSAGSLPSFSVKAWTSKRLIGICDVAVKVIKLTEDNVSSVAREIEYLKLVQGHENVIKLYDDKIKSGTKQLIMTELGLCDFFRIVSKGGPMATDMVKRFGRQLLEGVDYIHSCGIAHCDLKLENLLLGQDGNLKIADFGLALPYVDMENNDDGYLEYFGFIGTRMTAAPEVIESRSRFAPVKNDIWACGVIIMEFITGMPGLWHQASMEDPEFRRFFEDFESPLNREEDSFIRFILQINPLKRPLIFRILKHPWLQTVVRRRSHSGDSTSIGTNPLLEQLDIARRCAAWKGQQIRRPAGDEE